MIQLILPFLAVVLVGIGVALETPTNALLGRSSGSVLWASLISFAAGTVVLALGALILRPKLSGGWMGATPWYAWIGGVYGVAVAAASTWATPKLGAGTTLVVIVAAQVALGVVLDNFGLLGLEAHPASALRLAGIAVVTVGALLVALG